MKYLVLHFITTILIGLLAHNSLFCNQPTIKEDAEGNSYIYAVAQTGLCGYLTLYNRHAQQIVLEAFLFSGDKQIKKIGRYEWHNPTQAVQFSFDSAGTGPHYHYRIYCYPRFGEQTDKSDCINLLTIDQNRTRTRASCTTAAPWAGGRGTIPFKPLCMDELYKSAECKENR
ncbi:MAG: hypothetical protein ACOYT8_04265 [Candidatus Dependentiae bacterium]